MYLKSFSTHFGNIEDPRLSANVTYPLFDILFVSLCSLIAGANGWHAAYIPLTIQRRPFLIGFQNVNEGGVVSQQTVVHIDMDSPRISTTEGEAVFLAQGGQSPFLQNISSVLKTIDEGHKQTKAFIDQLLQNELLESVSIKVQLNDGTNNELGGLYTLNEEKVAALTGEALNSLHQQGYLQHIHMINASMSIMTALIEKKNQRL